MACAIPGCLFQSNKKARIPRDPGFSVVRTAVMGLTRRSNPIELPGQLRVPQESHLRKLPTAAHTYSQNWSRITSISVERFVRDEHLRQRSSEPCQAAAGLLRG